MSALLETRPEGLYCSAGDFYIDPWKPVKRAVITHAHGDHLHWGAGEYICSEPSEMILRKRISDAKKVTALAYRKTIPLKDAQITFHPAGHILGSSQIRIESAGKVWVMSGDYKRDDDPTCQAFEPVECDTFITEATFAYPFYRWENTVVRDIFDWWETNRALGKTSVLFCYALGKAQRVLAELSRFTDRTVLTHGAVESLNECYRKAGVKLLPTRLVTETDSKSSYEGELVIAPPSAHRSAWMRRFKHVDTGFASGWMRLRGNRRRRGYQRGFTLSDHADWPSLLKTIEETKAKRIYATHGSSDILVRFLRERGTEAHALQTAFEGEVET